MVRYLSNLRMWSSAHSKVSSVSNTPHIPRNSPSSYRKITAAKKNTTFQLLHPMLSLSSNNIIRKHSAKCTLVTSLGTTTQRPRDIGIDRVLGSP